MRYKHIIWDWNGTLLDDVGLCVDVMNGILLKYDKPPLRLEKYRDIFTFPVINYYQQIGFSKDDFEAIGAEFIDGYERRRLECSIFEGARELLEKNMKLGITQSVLSAYKQDTLQELVEYFELSPYFIALIGQDNIYAYGKMEQGRLWIKKLGLDKKDVVMIGDTYHDHEVAHEMGIDCILLAHGHQSKKVLATTGKAVAENFKELSEVLYR